MFYRRIKILKKIDEDNNRHPYTYYTYEVLFDVKEGIFPVYFFAFHNFLRRHDFGVMSYHSSVYHNFHRRSANIISWDGVFCKIL